MSDVPSKLWLSQAGHLTWFGHVESTGGDAVFYHIPQSVIDQARDDLITGETAGLNRLLNIIEGET